MRVEFVTEDDPIYLLPFFDEFFRHYGKELEIAQVSLCRIMGKRPRKKLAWEILALYGVPGFAKLAARVVMSKILGMLPKGPDASSYQSMSQLCRAYGIRCEHIASPNAAEFLEAFQQRKCDVLISVACPYILKKRVLSIPPRGCINIHHAPLPRYKGMMPTFWQLYHGEKTVGLTIHYMTENLDEGGMLYQTQLDILPGESLHRLICRSKRHGAHCMAQVLRALNAGSTKLIELDHSVSSSFTFPTSREIRDFRMRGLRAI